MLGAVVDFWTYRRESDGSGRAEAHGSHHGATVREGLERTARREPRRSRAKRLAQMRLYKKLNQERSQRARILGDDAAFFVARQAASLDIWGVLEEKQIVFVGRFV